MIVTGPSSPFEKGLRYVMMVYRQRWAIVCCAILGLGVGIGLLMVLDKQYESKGTLMVEPKSFGITGENASQIIDLRLRGIEPIIKGRVFLEEVIRNSLLIEEVELGIPKEKDAAIADLQDNVTVSRPHENMVTITYRHTDFEVAANVARRIIDQFQNDIDRDLSRSLDATILFIDKMEEEFQKDLREVQARVVEFKEEHIESLPGAESNILQRVEALKSELMQVELNLKANRARQAVIQDKLAATAEYIDDETTLATSQDVLLQRRILNERRLAFDGAAARYTPKHSSYRIAEKALEEAEAELARLEGEALGAVSEKKRSQNPYYLVLLERQTEVDLEAESLENKRANIEAKVESLRGRVQNIPELEQDLHRMTAELNAKFQRHTQIMDLQLQNQIEKAAAENNQQARFTVLDPPQQVETPVFPKPLHFIAGGLAMGMLVGFAIGFLREWFNQTIRSVEEVRSILAVPVLAAVPQLEYLGEEAARLTDERRKMG